MNPGKNEISKSEQQESEQQKPEIISNLLDYQQDSKNIK